MDIIIRNAGDVPIYEQIVRQIKSQILRGELGEGDALPSMRLLAKELRISVITTKRAYEELEREGFITTVPGKGCFVAPRNLELAREVCREDDQVDDLFNQVKKELIGLIAADADSGELWLDLIMVAKYLERIGDHATNVAEWVEYSITGNHPSNN